MSGIGASMWAKIGPTRWCSNATLANRAQSTPDNDGTREAKAAKGWRRGACRNGISQRLCRAMLRAIAATIKIEMIAMVHPAAFMVPLRSVGSSASAVCPGPRVTGRALLRTAIVRDPGHAISPLALHRDVYPVRGRIIRNLEAKSRTWRVRLVLRAATSSSRGAAPQAREHGRGAAPSWRPSASRSDLARRQRRATHPEQPR